MIIISIWELDHIGYVRIFKDMWICHGYVMDKSWIHGYMDIFFSPGVYLSIKQGYLSKKDIQRDIHEISKRYP